MTSIFPCDLPIAWFQPSEDYVKWLRLAYEHRYGKGSWERDKGLGVEKRADTWARAGFQEFKDPPPILPLSLGKRGVGFILITQYSTSIPPEVRNVGTYFIMSAMSETEIQRFKEVTLHPSSKLITRLPRATSFVFSPYWYPEPFFVRHRKIHH